MFLHKKRDPGLLSDFTRQQPESNPKLGLPYESLESAALVFILLVVISRCFLTIKQLLLSHTIEACPEQRSHYESDENRPTSLRQNIVQPACADTDELEAHDKDNRYNYVQTVAQNGILDLDGLPVFLFTHINTPFGPV